MPGSLKTQAIVLRSLRYGEADRILHMYTPHRGRLSAIAKGVRKARSRFGGRLEPYFRLDLGGLTFLATSGLSVLVDANARAREHGASLTFYHGGPEVERMLKLSGVDRLLHFEPC